MATLTLPDPDSAQVADFLYVVRGFTAHMEAPCAMLQTGQMQIHNRPPAGLKPRADAIQDLEVPAPPACRSFTWSRTPLQPQEATTIILHACMACRDCRQNSSRPQADEHLVVTGHMTRTAFLNSAMLVLATSPQPLSQDVLQKGDAPSSRAAEKVFQDAADSLWGSYLEVEVAGLRAGTSVNDATSGDLCAAGEPDGDRLASCQWALQSCRCLVKLVSSKVGVRAAAGQENWSYAQGRAAMLAMH